MKPTSSFGYVLGRFQPLHHDHIKYFDAAKSHCECLVVGITNPELNTLIAAVEDPRRSLASNNPFTFYERMAMISAALEDAGWRANADFLIVPSPINEPDRLLNYMPDPRETTCFVTIYDAWGRRKQQELESLGYRTEVLWERKMEERGMSGVDLREAIRDGAEWHHLVPEAIARHLEANGGRLLDRIRASSSEASA